jgi:hypothetical protein
MRPGMEKIVRDHILLMRGSKSFIKICYFLMVRVAAGFKP